LLLNLANEEKTCDIPMANTADLDAVVTAVKSAFESFSMTSREDSVNITIIKLNVIPWIQQIAPLAQLAGTHPLILFNSSKSIFFNVR
jgi:hypothetical protein